jgi:mono/diheme cytochrome c family protein
VPETLPPLEDKDPVVTQSLSAPLLVSSFLLVLSLVWAVYDEIYGQRPWKAIQQRFVQKYTAFLTKVKPRQADAEKTLRQSDEYRKLEQAVLDAEKAIAPRLKQIDREVNEVIAPRLAAITDPFALVRSEISAVVYKFEVASSQRAKDSLNKEVESIKARPVRLSLPSASGDGKVDRVSMNFSEIEEEFNRLQARKAELAAQRGEILRPVGELRANLDAYMNEKMTGLTATQVEGLMNKMKNFSVDIKQIHVKSVDLVDRCESCHLGIREPLTLTKADMGGEGAFISHPRKELLEIHDPERFGCTPCHNGNGTATTSVRKAHGRYKHWLWPLYGRENVEAGCHQCHAGDLVLEQALTLNHGKEIFRGRGCSGCHRFEGFDAEAEALTTNRLAIRKMENERKELEKDIDQSIKDADAAPDNKEAQRLYAQADAFRQTISNMDHQMEQLDIQSKSLLREQKKIGPSLKEVRVKMRKEWIPVWLEDPHAYRPTTKMPAFRLDKEQREAIAAYIWQSGVDGQLPVQKPGDATRGKELFETRGCLGCHSVGEGGDALGGAFAANLSRVGEKDHYDYLVRWIRNPRERTRPFCPHEKRDLGPEDYAKKGLPFVFDLDHTVCPNDGHQLQVQQMTVMPNLRLTTEEAQDIASYLITLKRPDASYPAAPYLDDAKMKEKGLAWVKHYGCAGCHEIAGLEEEGRIGTELTKEGSQPIERLDFALLTHDAKKEGWYNHKGFFEHKLENPAVYDQGKVKTPLEKLRMPNFRLKPEEITAVTTFLLGSVDSTLPPHYFYNPKGQRQDIREGWWLINKYNCIGCHQVHVGQKSLLSGLPRYQDPDWKEQLPPTLIGEGARVDPNWLTRFLENPAMSATDVNRNGLRSYLKVRMPTFSFSDGEIRKIVRFFEALSAQAQPYIPTKLEPLTEKERDMARGLFTSTAAPCLKCHATGDPAHDRNATAPNFLLAKERLKPGWTARWMIDPAMIAPGTSMPSGLFRREGARWVFSGPVPSTFVGYEKDHADLLVRYMFQFTADEQRRLAGRTPAAPAKVARK